MTDVVAQNLTAKEQRFVAEYLIDLNATQAAIRAGYSERTAASIGSENLRKPHVAAAVSAGQAELAKATGITQAMVLQELWTIASANPNELVQFRRGACRECWSVDDDEPTEGLEKQAHGGALKRSRRPLGPMPALGADIDREPNAACLCCGGEGVGRAFIADTRKLSPAARRLYAGVKVTKDGIEVKMHDQAAALLNVGRHLGMFKDKVEITGTLTLEALVLESIKPKVVEGTARVIESPGDADISGGDHG